MWNHTKSCEIIWNLKTLPDREIFFPSISDLPRATDLHLPVIRLEDVKLDPIKQSTNQKQQPSLCSTSFCWYDKYLVPNLVSPHPVQSLGGPPIPTSAHDYQTVTAGQCRELWCNSAPEAEEFQLFGESWWSFETKNMHFCYIILKVLWMHLYHVQYHLWSYQRSSAANIHVVLRFQRCRQVR